MTDLQNSQAVQYGRREDSEWTVLRFQGEAGRELITKDLDLNDKDFDIIVSNKNVCHSQ